jgi:protein regulator of cytokinesis 1
MSTPTPNCRVQSVLPRLFTSTANTPPSSSASHSSRDNGFQTILATFCTRVAAAEAEGQELTGGAGLEGVDPTPALIAWAQRTRDDLDELKRRREAHIQAMYDQLEALWRRMGVPDADMDTFVDAHQGSTQAIVRAYEDELERMMEYKRERMGEFVKNARDEIVKLWDELMVGEDERADFALFLDGMLLCSRTSGSFV